MTKKQLKRYRVLRPVRSDKNSKYFDVGAIITSRDFMPIVIAAWLASDPPVLEEIDDGGNTER